MVPGTVYSSSSLYILLYLPGRVHNDFQEYTSVNFHQIGKRRSVTCGDSNAGLCFCKMYTITTQPKSRRQSALTVSSSDDQSLTRTSLANDTLFLGYTIEQSFWRSALTSEDVTMHFLYQMTMNRGSTQTNNQQRHQL